MFPNFFSNELLQLPIELAVMARLPSREDFRRCSEFCKSFTFDINNEAFEELDSRHFSDDIQAFRAAQGAHCYIEVGTYDRGSRAHAAAVLDDDVVLMDGDISAHPAQDVKLRRLALKPGQQYYSIVGDSLSLETLQQVKTILHENGFVPDLMFIDGNHAAEYVLSDFALYSPFVRPRGSSSSTTRCEPETIRMSGRARP